MFQCQAQEYCDKWGRSLPPYFQRVLPQRLFLLDDQLRHKTEILNATVWAMRMKDGPG